MAKLSIPPQDLKTPIHHQVQPSCHHQCSASLLIRGEQVSLYRRGSKRRGPASSRRNTPTPPLTCPSRMIFSAPLFSPIRTTERAKQLFLNWKKRWREFSHLYLCPVPRPQLQPHPLLSDTFTGQSPHQDWQSRGVGVGQPCPLKEVK